MSKYLVHCDGCGRPEVVENPNKFTCTNCGYQECTIDERPFSEKDKDILQKCLFALNEKKEYKEPAIGQECADLLEDLWSGDFKL